MITFRGHKHSLQRVALGVRIWDYEQRTKERAE